MNLLKTIEVIEDNAGCITVQDTETKQVAFLGDKYSSIAIESLEDLVAGRGIDMWELSSPDHYIEYDSNAFTNGQYVEWGVIDIKQYLDTCVD